MNQKDFSTKRRNHHLWKALWVQRLQPLVDRMLAKKPEDRYASAQDVEQALYAALLQFKGLSA